MCGIALLDFRSRRASARSHGRCRPARPRRCISGRTASAAATRARAAGRDAQLCATVLIAAIPPPVIRTDGMTPAGACRDWPEPKPPDDRRDGERVRRDVPSREKYEPKAHSSGARPGCGSRCRSAASSNHFHPSLWAAAHGTLRRASNGSRRFRALRRSCWHPEAGVSDRRG